MLSDAANSSYNVSSKIYLLSVLGLFYKILGVIEDKSPSFLGNCQQENRDWQKLPDLHRISSPRKK